MLLHRLILRLRYAATGLPAAGIILLFVGPWRWAIGCLAGGTLLYLLLDRLEARCRPRSSYDADENGNARPKYR